MKKLVFAVLNLSLCSLSVNAAINHDHFTSFANAYNEARNTSATMNRRWTALLSASDFASGPEFKKIIDFRTDKDWFMRNASLVALDKSGSDLVYDQAKFLIKDKALVVRSAAADILMRLNSDEIRGIFSRELEKKYNFSGKSSLWIRPQLMKHLAHRPGTGDRDFFVKYLHDNDVKVALLSTEALEKITSQRYSGKNEREIVAKWKDVAKAQKW